MNGILKKTLNKFVNDFKEFSKDEEIVKINKTVIDVANNLNMSVNEHDMGELLEVISE